LQPVRLTSVPSPFFLNRGEVPRTGTPFRSFSSEPSRDGARDPPWTGAARGPRARGLDPHVSFRKIILGNSNFGHFAFGPTVFPKSTHSPGFTVRSVDLKNIYKKVPSLRKSPKIAPKIHIFSTTTPNLVILVPKFSESLPLSFCAFI
jgi:hypothetical protein